MDQCIQYYMQIMRLEPHLRLLAQSLEIQNHDQSTEMMGFFPWPNAIFLG